MYTISKGYFLLEESKTCPSKKSFCLSLSSKMIPNVKSEIYIQRNALFMKKGISLLHYFWKENLTIKSRIGAVLRKISCRTGYKVPVYIFG